MENCNDPLSKNEPEKFDSDIEHFRRLVRVQGVEAAANCYTLDEIMKIMRARNFTYINPRARKIDLAHALASAL